MVEFLNKLTFLKAVGVKVSAFNNVLIDCVNTPIVKFEELTTTLILDCDML